MQSSMPRCETSKLLLAFQVETVDDYDEYCHYVAGLVGLGLSKLFQASELEVLIPDSDQLSNSMGLFLQVSFLCMNQTHFSSIHLGSCGSKKLNFWKFNELQKTNIIRDYLEDINEIPKSRMFWPRQIWSKYVNKLEV